MGSWARGFPEFTCPWTPGPLPCMAPGFLGPALLGPRVSGHLNRTLDSWAHGYLGHGLLDLCVHGSLGIYVHGQPDP